VVLSLYQRGHCPCCCLYLLVLRFCMKSNRSVVRVLLFSLCCVALFSWVFSPNFVPTTSIVQLEWIILWIAIFCGYVIFNLNAYLREHETCTWINIYHYTQYWVVPTNCQVGFMRNGRLLAQSSPENMMRDYNTTVSDCVVCVLCVCVCVGVCLCVWVCIVVYVCCVRMCFYRSFRFTYT